MFVFISAGRDGTDGRNGIPGINGIPGRQGLPGKYALHIPLRMIDQMDIHKQQDSKQTRRNEEIKKKYLEIDRRDET